MRYRIKRADGFADENPAFALAKTIADTGDIPRALTRREYRAAYREIRAIQRGGPGGRMPVDPDTGTCFAAVALEVMQGNGYGRTHCHATAIRYLCNAARTAAAGRNPRDEYDGGGPLWAYHHWRELARRSRLD